MFHQDVTLENEAVLLRMIRLSDAEGLAAISGDAELWSFFVSDLSREQAMKEWVEEALLQKEQQIRLPFVIIDKKNNTIAGCTSYGNIAPRDKRLEIGWTWLGKKFQRTGLNRHCKYLLLSHAFDTLQCERVEFKTDVLNRQSRAALRKIGAVEEGVLRSHMVMPGNRRRDSVYYSILRTEWAEMKPSFLK